MRIQEPLWMLFFEFKKASPCMSGYLADMYV